MAGFQFPHQTAFLSYKTTLLQTNLSTESISSERNSNLSKQTDGYFFIVLISIWARTRISILKNYGGKKASQNLKGAFGGSSSICKFLFQYYIDNSMKILNSY